VESGYEDFAVAGVGEPVWGDDGEDSCVVADYCDVAAGKGRCEAGEESGVVAADGGWWGRE